MANRKSSSRLFERLVPARLRAGPVVPVIRLSGAIGIVTPLRPGLTLSNTARLLERAFKLRRAAAVAIAINSPGGSAVQSHLIFLRIRQLADERKMPVFAFVEDVAASGGYMIACAADEIVCDPSSILGSIGVVGAAAGFEKAIRKLGIERRVYTAGKNKAMLDPFMPEKPEDVKRLKAIQEDIHRRFIALVKSRRGRKLNGPESALFSGVYWGGEKAVKLGLADGVGDLRSFLRARFGDKVQTPLIAERGWFGRRMPVVGTRSLQQLLDAPGLGEDIVSALETRALWARYGF